MSIQTIANILKKYILKVNKKMWAMFTGFLIYIALMMFIPNGDNVKNKYNPEKNNKKSKRHYGRKVESIIKLWNILKSKNDKQK